MSVHLDIDNTHLLSGPLNIAFDVTNKCMARCIHCFNRSGNELQREELTDEEFLKVIDQMADIKLFSTCYCGGEPLIRYDLLVEATRRFKMAGVVNVAMVSNGWLMNEEKAKGLSDAGVDMVQISLDGSTPETHERLRGIKGIYDRALRAMELVNNTKMHLSVAFCPTRFNLHQFPEVVDLVSKFEKLTTIRIQPFMPMGKGLDADDIIPTEEEYRHVVRFIEGFNNRRQGTFPTIEWGDPIDHLRRFVQLNFKQNSFLEIKSDGKLSISSYLPLRVGDLRKRSLREYWGAGLGQAWRLPVVQELAGGVHGIGDLGFKDSELPTVFYDRDIMIDIIEDKPFVDINKLTLEKLLSRQFPNTGEVAG